MLRLASGLASYDYDPYGDTIQTGAELSRRPSLCWVMFYEPDSGLYLTVTITLMTRELDDRSVS